VRENYAVGEDRRILMVASDRLSIGDVIMGEPIPGKGALLTRMALFWFDKLDGIVPNHLTGQDPLSAVSSEEAEREQIRDRAMLVALKPLPVEAGGARLSGRQRLAAETQKNGSVCGVALPPACAMPTSCPPIFTPATKAEMGDHDENISFEQDGGDHRRRPRHPGARPLHPALPARPTTPR
jgi:phosphoribosylaminoimidazole-succinocarboxamide synthase